MKKTIKKQFSGKTAICLFFGAILFILLSGCPGPMTEDAKTATLTINLGRGGSGSRAALPDEWELDIDTDDLVHTITISDGPGATQKQEGIKAGQTARFTVAPGTWKVTVQSYYGTVLIAEGSKNVNVKSGENSPVPITMKEAPAIFTSINDFGLWLSYKFPNDYPYKVKLNVSNLSGDAATDGSLGYLLNNNPGKLVDLDLSGSTFAGGQIQGYAFSNCTELRGITLPDSIIFIATYAFKDTTGLESITIPINVTDIGIGAFTNSGLTSVRFLKSGISINSGAFDGNLSIAYLNGGAGTYTRASSGSWTKTGS